MVVAISSSSAALLGTCQYSAAACTPRSLARPTERGPVQPDLVEQVEGAPHDPLAIQPLRHPNRLSRVPPHLDN